MNNFITQESIHKHKRVRFYYWYSLYRVLRQLLDE